MILKISDSARFLILGCRWD